MTVGVFIDRLEQFRQGVLQYKEMSEPDQRDTRNVSGAMDLSESDALRDTLCHQFSLLDESVAAFSHGRYPIHLDSRGRQDIYIHALSEDGQSEHLDLILSDLQHMLVELQERPRHHPLPSRNQWPDNPGSNPQPSFGSLGHFGYSSTPASSATLHVSLQTVARIIHQRVDRPEAQEVLLAHVQAIVDHPEMAGLLPLPPSQLL